MKRRCRRRPAARGHAGTGLLADARRLAARPAGRAHAGHGHAARRAAGRSDDIPGAGRLAPGPREGADTEAFPPSNCSGATTVLVRRQDRNPDRQSHGGAAPVVGVRRTYDMRRRPARRCRMHCTACWSLPCWPATAAPSTRWRRRSPMPAIGCWPIPSTCTPTGPWSTTTRCRARCWRCRGSGNRPTGAERLIAGQGCAGGHRRPVPPRCCAQRARVADESRAMAADGLRVLGVARATFLRGELPGSAARLRIRVPRTRRAGRSGARRRAAGHRRMPGRRHPGRDDDRRSSRDCDLGRAAGGTWLSTPRSSPAPNSPP